MRELNKIIKKSIAIIALLAIAIFLTSCSGGRELNTLAIVVATGIDVEDGKVIFTNEVVNPAQGQSSQNASTQDESLFVQGFGNTISEAILNTTLTFDRELYFPHSHIVIFGEEVAKSGIGEYIDILSRHNEQREQANLLVAQGGKAYDVMGINNGVSQSPGHYIHNIIKQDIFNDETRTLTISEFFRYYYRKQEDYIMGVLKVIEKQEIDKRNPKTEFSALSVEGGAAFKDDKLVGYYTGKEMIGFNFIVGELRNAMIAFESPEYLIDRNRLIATTGKFSTVQIFRSKTKNDIKLIDGKLHLFINVKFRGGLKEVTQGIDINQPGVLHTMEEACAEKAKSYIESVLSKSQKEFGIDTFSIGELVHRKYPNLWREMEGNWDEIFRDLEYTINVTAHINDIGYTNTPPNVRRVK